MQPTNRISELKSSVNQHILRSIFDDAYYCVFDEAPYFVHDAAFNENTNQVLEYLNRCHVYIGMTATDEPVKMHLSNHSVHDFLYGLEQKTMAYAKDRTYKQQQAQDIESHGCFDEETQTWSWLYTDAYGRPCRQKMPQSQFEELKNPSSPERIDQAVACLKPMDYPEPWKVISLPNDYSRYHVYYYHTDDELLRRIEQTPEEKWLIFSMNSEAGIELTEQINWFLHADDVAVFLDSALIHTKSTSNSERRARRIQRAQNTYCEIRDTSRFSCRVLVTTTVLDNGVNLHDRALRHIVLPTHDKTEFMQMIGRKRLAEGETANLYIQETAYKTIAQERYSVQRDMQQLQNFLKLNETKEITSHRNPLGYATRFQIKYPGDQIRRIMAFMRKCKRPLLINAEFRYGSSEADSYENRVKRLRDWKINQLAFCNLLYSLKLCSDFRACRNSAEQGTPQYEHPVLWSQLQWLGKEYDPTCWLDYEVRKETRGNLQKQLLADCEKGYFIEGAAALEAYIGDLIKLLYQINVADCMC